MDKELLFKPRTTEREVEIPNVGTVRVRALTRAEVTPLSGREIELDVLELRLLTLAMVDPVLTEDEVRQWYQVSPAGELNPVLDAIRDLSGVTASDPKEAYHRFRS